MSLSEVKPYVRTVMDQLGYSEWTDGFNLSNIPSTVFDESYHVEAGGILGSVANQRAFRYSYPITVRVFLKGFRDPSDAIDDALLRADSILANMLSEDDRLGVIADSRSLKNVSPSSVQVIPLAASNDNSVILEMGFNFDLIECY